MNCVERQKPRDSGRWLMFSGKKRLFALAFYLFTFLPFPLVGLAQAQPQLTLPQALNLAFTQGPDLTIARANLEQAQANLRANQADPSTPEDTLVRLRNAQKLAEVRLNAGRLEVTKNVLAVYLGIYEAQQSIALLETQVAFNNRNVEVARARLGNRVGTQLDVSKAENTLATSRQTLSDTRAQRLVLVNRLETLLGLASDANPTVAAPPVFAAQRLSLETLEQGLYERVAGVVEIQNNLTEAELAVKLSDNDYTPALNQREARTARDNAQRGLTANQQSAKATLRDAVRNAANTLELVQLRSRDLANAQETHTLNQTRFKAGTISGLQLQGSELELRSAQLTLLQAQNAYLRALSELSVAAGMDVTGWVQ